MRFEQITTTVVRNFVAIEARVNLVVDVLAAAYHLGYQLRKPLGTLTSQGSRRHSQMHRSINMAHHLFDDGGPISSSSWLCFKRTGMLGCPAMACTSSPVRARRMSVSTY